MKRILLDTECWLWWHFHPERLGAKAEALLEERGKPLLFSAASSWEIAIKVALGKLELPFQAERFVPEQLAEDGIVGLPIEHAHALRVASLPPHHADPFDRLLVAQVQLERAALLTADPQMFKYEIELMWAGHGAAPDRPRVSRRTGSRSAG